MQVFQNVIVYGKTAVVSGLLLVQGGEIIDIGRCVSDGIASNQVVVTRLGVDFSKPPEPTESDSMPRPAYVFDQIITQVSSGYQGMGGIHPVF
jgi:hypothetical protein